MVVSTLPELEYRLKDGYTVSIGDPEVYVTTDAANDRDEGEWIVAGEKRGTWDEELIEVNYYKDGTDGTPDEIRKFEEDSVTLDEIEDTIRSLL